MFDCVQTYLSFILTIDRSEEQPGRVCFMDMSYDFFNVDTKYSLWCRPWGGYWLFCGWDSLRIPS